MESAHRIHQRVIQSFSGVFVFLFSSLVDFSVLPRFIVKVLCRAHCSLIKCILDPPACCTVQHTKGQEIAKVVATYP